MKLPARVGCVITGAGSGLGRALALRLAERNAARVVLADIDRVGAEDSAERVRRAGGQAWVVECDVREWDQVGALADQARRHLGSVDLVANNAGVAAGGWFGETPLEDWRWVLDINLWGVIHGCRAFVPTMREQGRGWLLNVASAAGLLCMPQFAAYNVSKAGVIALSETLHTELAHTDVTVTVLCPSFFATNIAKSARGTDVHTRDLVQRLMDASTLSAGDVADQALLALERRELYAVPMRHAKAAWWAKRRAPQAFHGLVGFAREHMRRWEARA